MSTILLTWGTWFLGSHLLKKLCQSHTVIVLKRTTSSTSKIEEVLSHKNIHFYDVDLIDCADIFKKHPIDVVVHTATNYGRNNESVRSIIATNLIFPVKLLELCVTYKVGAFINFDTFFTRGIDISYGVNFYVNSKKDFAKYGEIISVHNEIKFINLKLEHLYGPYDTDDKKFIPYIIKQLLSNVQIDLTAWEQHRDLIYVTDVVSLVECLLSHLSDIETRFTDYEVGSGVTHTIKEVVLSIKEVSGSTSDLNFGKLPYRQGESMFSVAHIEPLEKLGWKPVVGMKEGVAKTVEYIKSIV